MFGHSSSDFRFPRHTEMDMPACAHIHADIRTFVDRYTGRSGGRNVGW